MSVISRKTKSDSSLSSILKKSVPFQNKLGLVGSPRVKFHLPHSERVRSILQKYSNKEDRREYENLVCLIRDCDLADNEISLLLQEANDCIDLLSQELTLFVEVVVNVRWAHRSQALVEKYKSFLVNLLSAHNYHTKVILDSLVSNFLPGNGALFHLGA